jgi:methionyl-tRNA formyltransferase
LRSLKLLFMGTPAFALPSLNLLDLSPHTIAALVVPPDRPVGRGRKVRLAPTREWALQHGVITAQPDKINDRIFIDWLEEINPDLIVTVAFGRLLPRAVLQLPALGCINLHASYLPAYRGSAPIHRAVIDGAPYSGVTVMHMAPELDAGDIIMQEKEPISKFDTAGMLHDRLADRGAALLLKAVDALAEGSVVRVPQDHSLATYAPPLTADDERLDWNLGTAELYNRIRGLNPWPGAYTTCGDRRIKVWKAAPPEVAEQSSETAASHKPGTILAVGEASLTIATGDGALTLLDLQPAGKKAMDAGSFCCGYRIEPGSCLDGA